MSKIDDVKIELTKLGIAFDDSLALKDLQKLLPADDVVANESDDEVIDGITVKDPDNFRPVELPLVVTLPEGASKAQIAFAKVLNAYAYQSPIKWRIKKDALIKQLVELKNAPDPVEAGNLKINQSNIL